MRALSAWMAGRRPAPPEDLAGRLRMPESNTEPDVALAAEARARLEQARAHTGRVRETAFRLLEADALLTYACESALETEDPDAALRGILASTRA